MSKERELLNRCAVTLRVRNICPLLLKEITELLAQPEPLNLEITEFQRGFARALDLLVRADVPPIREPMSDEEVLRYRSR